MSEAAKNLNQYAEYVITMRSRTTHGVDTDQIRVFEGQDVKAVAASVADGYGANVEGIANLDGSPYLVG